MAVAAVISCISDAAESSVICLASEGAFVIVGRGCGAIDFMTGHRRECRVYTGIKERVIKLVPILGGLKFAALSANGLLTLWDVKSRKLEHSLLLVEAERAFDMVLADESLYVACQNRTVTKITLADDATRLVRGAAVYKDPQSALTCLATRDGARRMLAGTADGRVISFNAESRSGGIQTIELPRREVISAKKRRKLLADEDMAEMSEDFSEAVHGNVFLIEAEKEARRAAAKAAFMEDLKYHSINAVLALSCLDSRVAVASDAGGRIFLLSIPTATIIQEHSQSVAAPISAIYAQSPSAFFTASLSGKVVHYCRSSSERRAAWIPVCERQTHLSDSTAVIMDQNDRVVVGGADGYLRIYESVGDFDSYQKFGSVTPLSLNTHLTSDNERMPKLILEGNGTRTLLVWSMIRTKTKALHRMNRRIAQHASDALSHPLCRELGEQVLADYGQDKWEVVKIAEIEFRRILEFSAVISLDEERYALFAQTAGSRYWFELDLKNHLSLKKFKFSNYRPNIASQLGGGKIQICGIWPIGNSHPGEALLSICRKEDQACSVSLAILSLKNDSIKSIYSATDETPITDLQIVNNLILRPTWHGSHLMKLMGGGSVPPPLGGGGGPLPLGGGGVPPPPPPPSLERLGMIHPPNTMQSTVMILGERFVVAVDFHRPILSVYEISSRRWIVINEKYKIPESYHTSLLISGGVSVGERRFLVYSARSMLHITLDDHGRLEKVALEEVHEMTETEHIGTVCYSTPDAEIIVLSNNQSNHQAYQPRVYGRA